MFYAICVCTFGSTPNTMTASLSNTIPTSFRVGTMFAVIPVRGLFYSTVQYMYCNCYTNPTSKCRNPMSAEHSNPAVLYSTVQ